MMEEKNEEITKLKFFKQAWYSISKIEKYPDMAAEGFKRAIGYLVKIVAILTFIVCICTLYHINSIIQEGVNYIEKEFPEFSYKDGKLEVLSEEKININESYIGKIIVDTKTEEEAQINKYINEVTENGEGIVILKDKVIIKNFSVAGTISYSYKEAFDQMKINEFSKQDVIHYANSTQILSLYLSIFLMIFVYAFIIYFLTTISNIVLLSAFGYITTLLARIKMRYVAIFNMSVYAITLSVILNMIYILINIFIKFNMEYFQVMYISVAAIYLVAAILILKTDFIKKQLELMKIKEEEKTIKKDVEENREDKKEEKSDKKETSKNEQNETKTKKNNKSNDKKEEKKDKKTDNKGTQKKTSTKKNAPKKKEEKEGKTGKQKSKDEKKEEKGKLGVEPEGSNA